MAKRILLKVAVCTGIVCGGGVAYASLFGEENFTLFRQLTELMGIHNKIRSGLAEAREGVDLAMDTRDDVLRSQALIEELHAYSLDRFIEDFKQDARDTYPDLDYIINKTGAETLNGWEQGNLGTPMGSYEFIGRVFGEVTEEMQRESKDGVISLDAPIQRRVEASAALTTSAQAEEFVKASDQDIEDLVQALNGATREEAVVIQAKLSAIIAAQNSHVLRMQARQLRREGMEDARRYQGSIRALATAKEAGSVLDLHENLQPALLDFSGLE